MIGDNVLSGEPFRGVDIFDIHAHIHQTSDFQMLDTTPDDVVKTMDALGISGACVSSITSIHSDCRLGNELMLDAVKRHSGRLYGYVVVSPHDTDVDLSRYFEYPGILGLKVHAAFHRTTIDDPGYIPFWEFADGRSLPVLFHAWEAADSVCIAKLAERYRCAKFIIGHGAVRIKEVRREAVNAVRRFENVWADTTISLSPDGTIEDAAAKLGADRLCYGSDIPFYDCRHVLGKVATSRLSDAEKEKILGQNARRILFQNE
ncbi:MAG: amidohydrolase family protein [Clostridia bacterium]|nr:amidohydrolase family protein [Clostridia bacterium]